MRANHIKWNEDMGKRCMSVFAYTCKNTNNIEVTDTEVTDTEEKDSTEEADNFVVKEEFTQSSTLDDQYHFINSDAWIEKDCLNEVDFEEHTVIFDEDNDAKNSSPNEPSHEETSDNSDLIMTLFLTDEQEDTLEDLDTYQ